MKTSNLIIFFFAAGGTPARAEEDDPARRFWRNGYAYPKRPEVWKTGVRYRWPLVAAATATTFVTSAKRRARSGIAIATASADVALRQTSSRRTATGMTTSTANAHVIAQSARVSLRTGPATAIATAAVRASSARRQLHTGRVAVTIGPDEVLAELEEILFLLEVA